LASDEAVKGEIGGETVEDSLAQLWQWTLDILAGQTTWATFTTYFAGSRLISAEKGVYVIAPPSELLGQWIEFRFAGIIKRALSAVAGEEVIELKIESSKK